MARDKVVLAYSGGLDTSVMVPWIGEKYNLDVVTFTVLPSAVVTYSVLPEM